MFKVGDRVQLVTGESIVGPIYGVSRGHKGTVDIVDHDDQEVPYRVILDGWSEHGPVWFREGQIGSIQEPPTEAETPPWVRLRRLAEDLSNVPCPWDQFGQGNGYRDALCASLRLQADELEAAATPKPEPTLADRLEELWEKRGRQGFELGIVREFAEILRGEDKSPVKALAREFVDGYPTKMWPQGLLVEAFRDALAREEPSE